MSRATLCRGPRVRFPGRRAVAAMAGVLALGWASAALAGEETYRNAKHFEIKFPEGWTRIPEDAEREYAATVQALLGQTLTYQAFYERVDAAEHFAYPYVMVDYHGGDTRFYREFSSQMEKGFRQAADTLSSRTEGLLADVEFGTPVLEAARSRFWVKAQMVVADTPVTGLSCLQMGSQGIAVLNCYAESATFAEHEATFRAMADSIRFDAAFRHDPAARPAFFSTSWGRIVLFSVLGGLVGLVRAVTVSRRRSRTVWQPAANGSGDTTATSGPRPPAWYTRPATPPAGPLAEPLAEHPEASPVSASPSRWATSHAGASPSGRRPII